MYSPQFDLRSSM